MNWRAIRLWALMVLITADLLMIGIMCLSHEWYWASVYSAITGVILIAEALSYVIRRKTISTNYGEWIKRQPLQAFLSLGLLMLVFTALAIHLLAYGFK